MRPDGPSQTRAWIGIDIGGTFSDVVALDGTGEVIAAFKVLSTQDDPAEAVLAGLTRLEDRLPSLSEGRLAVAVFHGTTIATNALIQKRGAKAALLTTEGCRDVLELRRQARPDLAAPGRPREAFRDRRAYER